MSRTLAVAFLLITGLITAATAGAQTVAKPVKVGDAAPDFTLIDHHGTKVTLSDSKGKSPVILVFYRGYW
jgi:cytochrome oxidase Cu insertion factor (SCO1/SenC/PrrC family)